jgi:DNA/RNA endonuclease YhcR with UshA esterase domain
VRTKLVVMAACLSVVMATAPAVAHHSFAAEYDKDRPVKLTGVVTKIEWTNPHIWFFVDVKDETGTVTNWAFSGAPPGVLDRRGISKHVLKPGDVVVVEGFRARDGSNNASGASVTFPDGRMVFTASAEDALPKSGANP